MPGRRHVITPRGRFFFPVAAIRSLYYYSRVITRIFTVYIMMSFYVRRRAPELINNRRRRKARRQSVFEQRDKRVNRFFLRLAARVSPCNVYAQYVCICMYVCMLRVRV